MNPRVKNLLISFLPTLLSFALQFIISFFVIEIAVLFVLGTFTGSSYSEFMDYVVATFTGQTVNSTALCLYGIAALAVSLIWFKKFLKKKQPDFHVTGKPLEVITEAGNTLKGYHGVKLFFGMLITGICLQIVTNYLLALLAIVFPDWLTMYENVLKTAGLDSINMSFLLFVYMLIGPISEELVFRGLTFGYARRALPFAAANLIQALLFGLIHVIPIQGVLAAVMGLVLGYIYGRTRNIYITIIVHLIFNFSTYLLEFIPIGALPATGFFIVLLLSLFFAYAGIRLILSSVPVFVIKEREKES